jgi:hypothetical protein
MTMRTTHRSLAGRGVAGSVLAVVGLLLAVDGACAQDPNLLEQQILKALVVKKPAISRSFRSIAVRSY